MDWLTKFAVDVGSTKVTPPTGGPSDLGSLITKITNILMTTVGIVAVIMIIIGGLMYIFSGGNPESTKRAKDTVLYAVIGIIVAILSYAIVNFVIGNIK